MTSDLAARVAYLLKFIQADALKAGHMTCDSCRNLMVDAESLIRDLWQERGKLLLWKDQRAGAADPVTPAVREAHPQPHATLGSPSDLVQRLRSNPKDKHDRIDGCEDLMREAADAVEALEQENAGLKWFKACEESLYQMAADLKRLRAELAEARKDAERLDWVERWAGVCRHVGPTRERVWLTGPEGLRANIDAAMEGK